MSIDLTTLHGPIEIASPVVVGACPLTASKLQQIALVSSGAGAIVLPSLFEEQVIVWNQRHPKSRVIRIDSPELIQHCQELTASSALTNVDDYLALIRQSKDDLGIPVIASLNAGCQVDRFAPIARELAAAGADGIEFHIRRPTPSDFESHVAFESAVLQIVRSIKNAVSVPLFLKLSRDPNSLFQLADELVNLVDGIVLFGRSPNLDIELDSVHLSPQWGLTPSGSITSSLQSLMQVHQHWPEIPLTASGGIGDGSDLVKVLLAGAKSAMVTSAIYRKGPEAIKSMLEGLIRYMERMHVTRLDDLRAKGSHLFDPEGDRCAYISALSNTPSPQELRRAKIDVSADRWGHPLEDGD